MRVLSNATLVGAATALWAVPCGVWAQAAASEPAAAGGSSGIGGIGGFGSFGGELLLLALLAVCTWTVIYVLKRKRQLAVGGGHERVQVLGMTSLGVRERVVVLRVRERTLLVGVTAAQITLLAELDAQLPRHSTSTSANVARDGAAMAE
jgi:flagellar biogenesis protein FliO